MRAFWNAVRIALRAIARSKLRAALTVLGILIGVAAVVIVVALGTGTRDAITAKFSTLGANIIYMWAQPTQQSGVRQATRVNLTEADGEALVREATSIALVVPFSSAAARVVFRDKELTRRWASPRTAGGPESSSPRRQSWTDNNELLKTKVCVIGDTVRENIFGSADPVGQYVRIGRYPFRVVGVLAKKGNSPFGEDQDDRILMPIGSFRARLFPMPPGRVMTLMASAKTENSVDRAVEQITDILRQRHKISQDGEPDFQVRSPLELRRSLEKIFDTLTVLLSAIAGVSLLVGGVGVMNARCSSASPSGPARSGSGWRSAPRPRTSSCSSWSRRSC